MSKNIKDLRAFMRESVKSEKIVTAPGPETFKDENGTPVMFEFKILKSKTRDEIRKGYTKKSIASDERGKPIIGANNEVAFEVEIDFAKIGNHLLAEALVYPNLKDPELMKFFECYDITEMPGKVFTVKELEYVFDIYNKIQAGEEITADKTESIIAEIKN